MSNVAVSAIDIDFDGCDTDQMRAHLVELYNQIIRGLSGNQRMRVRHLERWTEYHAGNWSSLKAHYEMLCSSYCEASKGLPRFSPRRGGPHYLRV